MSILEDVMKYKQRRDAEATADISLIPQIASLYQQGRQQQFDNQIKSLMVQAQIAKAGYKVGPNGQLVKDPSFAQSNPVFTIDDQGNLVQAGSVPKGGVVKQLPQSVQMAGDKARARAQGSFDSEGNTLDRASKLRNELRTNPIVKDFQEISSKVNALDGLLTKANKGDNASLGTLDQGLVTIFNKITDPQSVVRESEYARTPEGGSLIARFEGNIQKLQKGGVGLTPELRTQLVSDAKIIADGVGQSYNQIIDGYQSMAADYKVDPKLVLGSYKRYERFQKKEVIGATASGNKFKKVS